jgi:hypothetical protein
MKKSKRIIGRYVRQAKIKGLKFSASSVNVLIGNRYKKFKIK